MNIDNNVRCEWGNSDPLLLKYHDEEWGVPVHDDRKHFEYLVLDGAQAGLSWATILRKREGYRRAFEGFDPERVARFTSEDEARLLLDANIVRNRLKIASVPLNARAFLRIQDQYGSFDDYIWRFVGGNMIVNRRKAGQSPATSSESDAMSKDLRKHGFKFVGSTICYAYMQAAGLVNDHLEECYRHAECRALAYREDSVRK